MEGEERWVFEGANLNSSAEATGTEPPGRGERPGIREASAAERKEDAVGVKG